MSIPRMGRKDEDRLATAVDAFKADPNLDDDPNIAIAKAAADSGVPSGHLAILVRAYNNSRAAMQREAGTDAFEKAAEYPIASEDVVRELVFPADPTTKTARERAEAISPEYQLAPDWSRFRAKPPISTEEFRKKLAAHPAPEPYPRDEATLYRTARSRAQTALDQLDQAERAAKYAGVQADAAIDAVTDDLRRLDAPAWSDLRKQAGLIHGSDAVVVLDLIAGREPRLVKKASLDAVHRVSRHQGTYDLIGKAAEALKAVDAAATTYLELGPVAYKKVAVEMAPFLAPESEEEEEGSGIPAPLDNLFSKDTAAEPFEKEASPVGLAKQLFQAGIIRKGLDAMEGTQDTPNWFRPKADYDEVMNQIVDPTHEARIHDLENQYAIQSMLVDDPILRSYKPDEIAAAFNEISSAAPHLASRPLVMRPLLRKALVSGGMDTFDANQAMGVEKDLGQAGKLPGEMQKTQLESAMLRKNLNAVPPSPSPKPKKPESPPPSPKPKKPESPPPKEASAADWSVEAAAEHLAKVAAHVHAHGPLVKKADGWREYLANLVNQAKEKSQAAGGYLANQARENAQPTLAYFNSLPPAAQYALLGGGITGVGGGLLGLAQGRSKRRALSQAAVSGLLGAGTAAALGAYLPEALSTLGAETQTPEEKRVNFNDQALVGRVIDSLTGKGPKDYSPLHDTGETVASGFAGLAASNPGVASGAIMGRIGNVRDTANRNYLHQLNTGMAEGLAAGKLTPAEVDAIKLDMYAHANPEPGRLAKRFPRLQSAESMFRKAKPTLVGNIGPQGVFARKAEEASLLHPDRPASKAMAAGAEKLRIGTTDYKPKYTGKNWWGRARGYGVPLGAGFAIDGALSKLFDDPSTPNYGYAVDGAIGVKNLISGIASGVVKGVGSRFTGGQ